MPYAEEQYGSKSLRRRYACDHRGVRRVDGTARTGRGVWITVLKFLKEVFLPHGYPESVSDDYLTYQVWDTLQAFCSSITGTLATLAILKGVGVGDSSATPLAATITWMVKDGAGMLGRILFAWVQGTDLDCNAKKWRLVADFLNDLGTFLELLAPLFPHLFLLIVCAASISRAIVGTAGGATRAALIQHQARRDNMADVAAKDSSQETLVNLIALLISLVLTPNVAGKTELIWSLFITFTFFHLYANYRAVAAVKMETLNQNRLHIIMRDYLSSGTVPTPASANAREPIIRAPVRKLSYKLGVPLSHVLTNIDDYESATSQQKYILKLHRGQRNVAIALHRECEVAYQLKAAMVVETMDYIFQHKDFSSAPLLNQYAESIREVKDLRDGGATLTNLAHSVVEGYFPLVMAELQRVGWVVSHHLLGVDEWRYSWQWNTETDRKDL